MADRRFWFLAFVMLIPSSVFAQINSAADGCAVLDAVHKVAGGLDVIPISLEVWSTAREPWSYEVETSSGAIYIVSSDATLIDRVRDPQSGSRKQLERDATARAVLSGVIPGLCDLITEHYRDAPESILLEAELEYERGSYEGSVEYRTSADSPTVREREWEWDR